MIPCLFISGFLGAGKTTLLNNLLRQYAGLKIGVIVNDFGDLAVDNALIERENVGGEILELRAGQIFCSCLSGKFVESVLAYKDIQPDLLLVECSGLAKPATLADIVKVIEAKGEGNFDYAGMVAVIDGTRHTVLAQSLMVVTEQIETSDILLISKTDQLEKEERLALQKSLEDKYPEKIVLPVPKVGLKQDLMELLKARRKAFAEVDSKIYEGWGEKGRPAAFTLKLSGKSLSEIMDILDQYRDRWYRLKGTLLTYDEGYCYFDGVIGTLSNTASDETNECGVVVITHDLKLEIEMKKAFGLKPAGMQPLNLAMQ